MFPDPSEHPISQRCRAMFFERLLQRSWNVSGELPDDRSNPVS